MLRIKSLYLAIGGLLLTACGENWIKPEKVNFRSEFNQSLEQGRTVNYQPLTLQNLDALGLAQGPVTEAKGVEGEGHLSWLSYDIESTPAVDEENLKSYALDYIANNHGLFGVGPEELSEADRFKIELPQGLLSLNFLRNFAGFPVKDAFIEVVFLRKEDGTYRLREVVNRTYGDIQIDDASSFQVSVAALEEETGGEKLNIASQRNIIFPKIDGKEISFVMAAEVDVEDELGDFYTVFMDRHQKVLQATRHKVFEDAPILKARVYERSYVLNKVEKPLPIAPITHGNNELTQTDLDGEILEMPSGAANIWLTSVRGTVYNGNAANPFSFQRTLSNGNLVIDGNADELAALNVHIGIQSVNSFARQFISEVDTDYLKKNITIRINAQGTCNAMYNPNADELSFYPAGGGCGNTALISDVIYHEWGHGLDEHTGRTVGIADNTYSEGIGDIISAYVTGNSDLAPGFKPQGSTTPLRKLNNQRKYPDDIENQVHADGQIIGGAFWDLRKALIDRHGQTKGAYHAAHLFFNALLATNSYHEAYTVVLRLDDDDGLSTTKSPNHCLITEAFANHGLAQEEANCQDKQPSYDVSLDQSIVVGFKDRDLTNDQAIFMVSVNDAETVEACFGERLNCLGKPRVDLEFDFEGVADGKQFFIAKARAKVEKKMPVTIVVKNAQGVITGARTVKVFQR